MAVRLSGSGSFGVGPFVGLWVAVFGSRARRRVRARVSVAGVGWLCPCVRARVGVRALCGCVLYLVCMARLRARSLCRACVHVCGCPGVRKCRRNASEEHLALRKVRNFRMRPRMHVHREEDPGQDYFRVHHDLVHDGETLRARPRRSAHTVCARIVLKTMGCSVCLQCEYQRVCTKVCRYAHSDNYG